MNLFETVEQLDQQLFLFLNGLHHPALDPIMVLVSEKFFWMPVYLLLLFLVIRKVGWKNGMWVVLGLAVVITLCDQLSVKAFKDVFERYRPCHNLAFKELVHLPDGCGGQYGFVSSHAANYFGVSSFLALFFSRNGAPRYMTFLLMLWAALIAYSRIYLGVHYPLDILGGAILGSLIGKGVWEMARIPLERK